MTDTGEDALAAALAATGAEFAFGVPGGGASLAQLGAFDRAGIRFVLAHGETPACIMASVYGEVDGSVSAAVVTRGPGAASAVNGAAQATLDRRPLILVCDTVAESQAHRVPHQRIDQQTMLAPVCVATGVLAPSNAAEAIAAARQWPPGCVHLDQDRSSTLSGLSFTRGAPSGSALASSDGSDGGDGSDETLEAMTARIGEAERPVVIVGCGALDAADRIRGAIEAFGAPVFSTYQAVGVVDSESPLNAGLFTNGASERSLLEQADLIILVGLDMVEPIPAPWSLSAEVVSVAPSPTEAPYAPISIEAVGDVGAILDACLAGDHSWSPDAGATHRERVRSELRSVGSQGGLSPVAAVDAIAGAVAPLSAAGAEVTCTVDAGAHFLAVMPLWPVRRPRGLVISNGLATMGFAVPAAVGAALARPGQRVVAITGDGGMGMVLAELETIARLELPVTVVVLNDATLSLIKIKQGADNGGAAAVTYRPTDFAAAAEAHGVRGATARSAEELTAVLRSADDGSPLVVDVRIDPSTYPHLMAVTRG